MNNAQSTPQEHSARRMGKYKRSIVNQKMGSNDKRKIQGRFTPSYGSRILCNRLTNNLNSSCE